LVAGRSAAVSTRRSPSRSPCASSPHSLPGRRGGRVVAPEESALDQPAAIRD